MGLFNDEQKAGREAIHEYEQRHPAPPRPQPNPLNDELVFRKFVMSEFLELRKRTTQLTQDNHVLRHKMERLMSATDDLKAAAAAMDGRIDALSALVAAGTTAVLTAITAIIAGSNRDGSVPADVAAAVVKDMQDHLTAAEAKVADLGPAVASLDAAVHPAPPAPAPAAPPA